MEKVRNKLIIPEKTSKWHQDREGEKQTDAMREDSLTTSGREGEKKTDDMREDSLMTSDREGEKQTDDTRVNS